MLGFGQDDLDDADDYPQTHLDDDAYDEFLQKEFDSQGRLKGDPRVAAWIVVLIVLVLAGAVVAFL